MHSSSVTAHVDHWYVRWDSGELFRVSTVDDTSGSVQIEGFDGHTEVLDAHEWDALSLSPIDPPSGWPHRPPSARPGRIRVIWTESTLR